MAQSRYLRKDGPELFHLFAKEDVSGVVTGTPLKILC